MAVAAAALLCISSGFIIRSCSGGSPSNRGESIVVVENADSVENDSDNQKYSKKGDVNRGASKKKRGKSSEKKKKGTSSKKKKAEKTYPVRDPLSQPCD